MKVCIIGGSRFVGPYLVKLLTSHGHRVTVFNRGGQQSVYPEGVRFCEGDRNQGFWGVAGHFDVVIDMCAYTGAETARALDELSFDHFIHMSTAAAYQKTEIFPLTESSPIGVWPLWGDYNRGKVECERVLAESGMPSAIIRPVYILGPRNYADREHFIYSRILSGQEIILPGNGQALVQFVFAEEVAEAIALIVENRIEGAFNIAGDDIITLEGLVVEMAKILGKKPKIQFNPNADGEKFNEAEFPFANENLVLSNERIKKLGASFVTLRGGLKDDFENYYRHVIATPEKF
ncbi:MAG: hypothetical protein A3C11_00025 [Candidatus Sungbacteria bacterium RIFCSPHIGHO2_02_FULL_49_12]|uniref:NAD-dependent epimerase/dehydratase domain-containing protein n=1 Tax=Candidatus Sungbacteria bacterium RIFCSPHIGHO2_02_FULL_49_12 TaxID=1802271 RepID=A0A1G2KRG0_9BACT|nr:MAG: hypothetical protein A3C11_00025 [Candidatus Sungbacteria bacterium RIFCSPHIGHO2_02_FULL_49_12]